jgi:hypothetical protein
MPLASHVTPLTTAKQVDGAARGTPEPAPPLSTRHPRARVCAGDGRIRGLAPPGRDPGLACRLTHRHYPSHEAALSRKPKLVRTRTPRCTDLLGEMPGEARTVPAD